MKLQILNTISEGYKLSSILTNSIKEENFKYEYSIQIASFLSHLLNTSRALNISEFTASRIKEEYIKTKHLPSSDEYQIMLLNLRTTDICLLMNYSLLKEKISLSKFNSAYLITCVITFLKSLIFLQPLLNTDLIINTLKEEHPFILDLFSK